MDGIFNLDSATGGRDLDNNKISVDTFNRLAEKYQQKYMDADFYTDTYGSSANCCKTITQQSSISPAGRAISPITC